VDGSDLQEKKITVTHLLVVKIELQEGKERGFQLDVFFFKLELRTLKIIKKITQVVAPLHFT
jgi:hypothetical protein